MDWPTAQAPLIFFEGEDEADLISQFVAWRAKHGDRYNVFEICNHIFKDLKDNTSRANQAALAWQNDLTIQERIDRAIENGGNEPETLTKSAWQAKMLALVYNDKINAQSKSAMIKGLEAYAQSEGWIVKAVDKKTEDKTRRFPRIVMAQADAA